MLCASPAPCQESIDMATLSRDGCGRRAKKCARQPCLDSARVRKEGARTARRYRRTTAGRGGGLGNVTHDENPSAVQKNNTPDEVEDRESGLHRSTSTASTRSRPVNCTSCSCATKTSRHSSAVTIRWAWTTRTGIRSAKPDNRWPRLRSSQRHNLRRRQHSGCVNRKPALTHPTSGFVAVLR